VTVAPEQLLAAMADAYHVARDAVAEVSRAWATLEPLLETSEREVASLKKAAEDLGDLANALPELSWLESELARMRGDAAKDPLGAQGGLDRGLAPRLSLVRLRIAELHLARGRVTTGLRDAPALEREIADAHATARSAPALAARELDMEGAALPAVVDDSLLSGLTPWRERIAAAASAGHWASADVGLQRWYDTAHGYLAQDQAVRTTLDSLFATRTELTGRLSARRAQLGALGGRGAAVDPTLLALGHEAEALLRARPTLLTRASRAVDRYEAAVVTLAARARRG
jgi:hypothetical protein